MAVDCNVASAQPQTVHFEMTGNKAPLMGSHRYGVCWDGGVAYRSGEFWPYRINIVGDITTTYNDAGELIATLTNIRMVPSGPDDNYHTTAPHRAPWFGSISTNVAAWRAIALALVVTRDGSPPAVPSAGDPVWHKCLGGWYAAGVTCGTACVTDAWGNRPGGTWYIWNDKNGNGTPFSKTQYQTGGRFVADQTWNLGKVYPGDGAMPRVWIIAYPQEAVTNYDPHCNIPFSTGAFVSGISIDVQMLSICPPEISQVHQKDRVCDNCVETTLEFEGNELGGLPGASLEVSFKYKGQPWDQAVTVSWNAFKDEPTFVEIGCLIPSREVEWRARYVVGGQYDAKSEYSYGTFETLFVPPTDMIVPDINPGECTQITQGKELPHFNKEIGYYDYDWADDIIQPEQEVLVWHN